LRILLDECVDRRLAKELSTHIVLNVYQQGWSGVANGELLALAAREFDVFLTVDRNLSFQQSITNFDIAVVVVKSQTNRLQDLRKVIPAVLKAISGVKSGEVVWVGM